MKSLSTTTVTLFLFPQAPIFLANLGWVSLRCRVYVSLALIPVVGERLQEALDSSSLEGSETAQEGLQVAGSKLYLGGGRK